MTINRKILFLLLGAVVVYGAGFAQQQRGAFTLKDQTFNANGVSFTMVAVQGGTFTMGGTYEQTGDTYEDEEPTHKVTVDDFYIGKMEVTQALWIAVMGDNPSFFRNDNCPVECVSWNDCQKFIEKLNQLTGKKFRLPTEAEWEFAARGGVRSREYKYSGSFDIEKVGWCGQDWDSGTRPVGKKAPNELGLYDMSGNIYEWCSDWFARYRPEDQVNPKGAPSGENKVLRGGSWFVESRYARVSNRSGSEPNARFIHIGLRLAMSAK